MAATMRRRALTFIPLALVALVLVGLPVLAVTDSAPERFVRDALGADDQGCVPRTAESPGWRGEKPLPADRDEPRAVVLDGRIYLAGGVARITDYGKPSRVPGVERVAVESLRSFGTYDPRSGRYRALAPLPEPLNHIGFVKHRGSIYVVGGHGNLLNGLAANRDLYRYSVDDESWERLAPMPTARGAAATAVLGDRLYVAGGMLRGRALRIFEAYDFTSGRWTRLPDMPAAREHAPATVLGGSLYVVGGRDASSDALTTVFRYDPGKDRWSDSTPLPRASGGLEAIPVGDRLVALGGGNDAARTVTGAVQIYDAHDRHWSFDSDMRTPRHGFAAAMLGSRIYAIGGSPCALFAASDIVESYDADRVRR
jgi:hypothetical protein